jgi:hypothetical protein
VKGQINIKGEEEWPEFYFFFNVPMRVALDTTELGVPP